MASLEQQDQLMAQMLDEHRKNPHAGLEGERLRLHAAIHAVVETQISEGSPPETRAALERLMSQGLERHQATHAIGTVVSDEIFDIMTEKKRFDERRFRERLGQLSAESWRRTLAEMEAEAKE